MECNQTPYFICCWIIWSCCDGQILKNFLQYRSLKASIFLRSAFQKIQLSQICYKWTLSLLPYVLFSLMCGHYFHQGKFNILPTFFIVADVSLFQGHSHYPYESLNLERILCGYAYVCICVCVLFLISFRYFSLTGFTEWNKK